MYLSGSLYPLPANKIKTLILKADTTVSVKSGCTDDDLTQFANQTTNMIDCEGIVLKYEDKLPYLRNIIVTICLCVVMLINVCLGSNT